MPQLWYFLGCVVLRWLFFEDHLWWDYFGLEFFVWRHLVEWLVKEGYLLHCLVAFFWKHVLNLLKFRHEIVVCYNLSVLTSFFIELYCQFIKLLSSFVTELLSTLQLAFDSLHFCFGLTQQFLVFLAELGELGLTVFELGDPTSVSHHLDKYFLSSLFHLLELFVD